MKKIALVSAIALSGLFYTSANAQILQIGLRLGGHRPVVEASLATPSVAVDYNNADDYYYLPDVDAYYSVPEHAYYYNNGDNWVSAAYLPGEYRNYDWRAARHYEVRAPRPFLRADMYRERYSGRAYDWRAYNNRVDNRFDGRRDDRFTPRRDDRFDNRQQAQPRFERPGDQPRGAQHTQGNRDQNNQGGRGNRNDNGGQNTKQPQRSNGNGQQQRNDDHFAANRDQNQGHRFGK
ncbi:hypothetical protein [Mucilaginibacter sp. dw_454]|uniref:hypothetical protein n=1 Tax=Mucilaginibacter sp. dw_454 TaxID=2720079 RepID=UPI001BD1F1BB|nr:hypothetical protein [Mucilaginibacter sp. dw_454]